MNSKIKQEVKILLQNMINEEIHMIDGCGQLVAYLHEGHDFIYWDFDEVYGKLLEFPRPTEFHLWEPEALRIKLIKFEVHQTYAVHLVLQLLEEL